MKADRSLANSRDLPAATLIINVLLTSMPAAATLLLAPCTSHVAWATFLVLNYLLYLQRMVLCLHVTEHRPLFRSPALNAANSQLTVNGSDESYA